MTTTETTETTETTTFDWPDWVPAKVRDQVEAFWTCCGRSGGDAWRENAASENAPPFGDVVRLRSLRDAYDAEPSGRGRYVHAWNNIGRLVHDDGTFDYVSFDPGWRAMQCAALAPSEAP